MSTRPVASYANGSANDYLDDWGAALTANPIAPSGYCDTTITIFFEVSNHTQGPSTQTCGVGAASTDISSHDEISFYVTASDAGNWLLRFQDDFGYGGAVFLDGVAIDFKSIDLHGQDPQGIFYEDVALGIGEHTIDIYGQENCCDGYQYGQFELPGSQTLITFGAADGLNPVPTPASFALLCLGLIGVCVGRRKAAAERGFFILNPRSIVF